MKLSKTKFALIVNFHVEQFFVCVLNIVSEFRLNTAHLRADATMNILTWRVFKRAIANSPIFSLLNTAIDINQCNSRRQWHQRAHARTHSHLLFSCKSIRINFSNLFSPSQYKVLICSYKKKKQKSVQNKHNEQQQTVSVWYEAIYQKSIGIGERKGIVLGIGCGKGLTLKIFIELNCSFEFGYFAVDSLWLCTSIGGDCVIFVHLIFVVGAWDGHLL